MKVDSANFLNCSQAVCFSSLQAIASLALFVGFASGSAAAHGRPDYQAEQSLTPLQLKIEKQKERLNSAEVEERRDAVMRLGAMRRPEASWAALPALKDPSPTVRATAASALSALPEEERAATLIPLLGDSDEFVRQQAAYALGGTRSRRAVPSLIERVTADKSDGVRGAAVVALGEIGDQSAVTVLASLIAPPSSQAVRTKKPKRKSKENEFVLRAAAISLGQIGNRVGVPALIETLDNESMSPDVRREAARSLGLIADPSAVPALRAAMTSDDPYLSANAFEALRRIALGELRNPS